MLDEFGAFVFKVFILFAKKKNNGQPPLLTEKLLNIMFVIFTHKLLQTCSEDQKVRIGWLIPQAKKHIIFGELYDLIYESDLEETKIYLSEFVRTLRLNTVKPLKDPPKEIRLPNSKYVYNIQSFLVDIFLNNLTQ